MRGTHVAGAVLFVSLSFLPYVSLAAEGAASGRVTGPVLGVLFDPSLQRFQQIYGIPGSATLGPPIDVGVPVSRALLSPEGDQALVEVGERREIGLIRFHDDRAARFLPAEAPPAADLMALSPAGAAGAVFYTTPGKIVILSSLREATVKAREFAAPFGLVQPSGLAVSDDGGAVLAVIPDGSEDVLYTVAEGGLRLLARFGRVASVSFVAGTRHALVADSLSNRIYRIGSVGGSEELALLADERQGISGPVALAASGDSARVVVVNSAPPGIVVLDSDRGESSTVPCNCVPARLQTLRGRESFLLTVNPASPLWLLDTGPPSPRTLFVPAYREAIGRTSDGRSRTPIDDGRARR